MSLRYLLSSLLVLGGCYDESPLLYLEDSCLRGLPDKPSPAAPVHPGSVLPSTATVSASTPTATATTLADPHSPHGPIRSPGLCALTCKPDCNPRACPPGARCLACDKGVTLTGVGCELTALDACEGASRWVCRW